MGAAARDHSRFTPSLSRDTAANIAAFERRANLLCSSRVRG
jgi:hypothetical protein